MVTELKKQRELMDLSNRKPPQAQDAQPGVQAQMKPQPLLDDPAYKGSGKLLDQVALITGGDSGIGAAVAIAFAKEGADVAIVYVSPKELVDAERVQSAVEQQGRRCLLIRGDVGDSSSCIAMVEDTLAEFGKLDILVNNAAYQKAADSLEEIEDEELEKTFRTNVFGVFYLTRAALARMMDGSRIISTVSVVAYKGSSDLIDYASTKGAIVAFTRSLSQALLDRNIRVNAVAPGPIWTPFIPAMGRDPDEVADHGESAPMKRAGQPSECAPAFVFLASLDSTYITGQVIHANGGTVVNG